MTAKLAAATPTPIPALALELTSLDDEDDEGIVKAAGRGEVREEEATRLVVEPVDEGLGAGGEVNENGGGV